MNAYQRRAEYTADQFSKDRFEEKKPGYSLAQGLIKIHVKNASNLNPDSVYSLYHFSHP
jgi:STE24 endopeptidase